MLCFFELKKIFINRNRICFCVAKFIVISVNKFIFAGKKIEFQRGVIFFKKS